MKEVLFVLFCFTIGLVQGGLVFAGGLEAKLDGDDVLVPVAVAKAIPDYDAKKPALAAHDSNGWLISGAARMSAEVLKASEIKLTADKKYYRAHGMKGKRFQVVQLKDNKYTPESVSWAKLENFTPADWISEKDPGICILK